MQSAYTPLWVNGHFYPQQNQSSSDKTSKPCQEPVRDTVGLTTHIFSTFRIEEIAVPHVENKLVFRAMGDGSVGIEAPDHGLACDVNMHDEFVAHDLDEQYRASDDIVRVGVRAPVQQVFRSYAEINVFVHVGLHCGRFVRWEGHRHPA